MARAAIYTRVSRRDQREHLQLDETQELVARRGWTLVHAYTDHGVSGKRDRRPGLDQLLADARRRRFDILVMWHSSRHLRARGLSWRGVGLTLGFPPSACRRAVNTTT